MTELERKALLGDKQAQKLCTEMGIAIACPICGKKPGSIRRASVAMKMNNFKPYAVCCGGENCCFYIMGDTPQEALANWNTRSAPPIGRCGDCAEWKNGDCYRLELSRPTDYCSYFKPEEK